MNLNLKGQVKRAMLIVLMILLHTSLRAQINVNAQGTIKHVLTAIEKQTGYAFAYNQSLVDDSKNVSIELVDGDIHQLMKALLKDTNYEYRVYGKYIVISPVENANPDTGVVADVTKVQETPQKTNVVKGESEEQGIVLPQLQRTDIEVAGPTKPYVATNTTAGVNDSLPPLVYVKEPYLTTKKDYPSLSLYTNALYLATTTPNLGVELALAQKWTLNVYGGVNMWKWTKYSSLRHWTASLEPRFWLCRAFEGHYIGIHATYADYNMGHLSAIRFLDQRTYVGTLYGAGLTYGYHFPLGRSWGLELGLGLGYARLEYDKYKCASCHEKLSTETKNYFGPTKVALSLIYLLD